MLVLATQWYHLGVKMTTRRRCTGILKFGSFFALIPEDYKWYNTYTNTTPIQRTYTYSIKAVLAKRTSEIS